VAAIEGDPGRRLFPGLRIARSGLGAQRLRMETIAHNVANASATAPDGVQAFHRRIVELEEAFRTGEAGRGDEPSGVRVRGIVEDTSEGPRIYDPGHPHADADGYVQSSNVDTTLELAELMEARRVYEANASVFDALTAMLRRSIEI